MTSLNTFPSLDRLLPHTFGFDRVFDMLDEAANLANSSNLAFPPANIVQIDDTNFVIELAIAGYKKDEIDITLEKNALTISGKKADKDERKFLVKGIAGRSFTRTFVVLDTVEIEDAVLTDGILSIYLKNNLPTHPVRKIAIK